MQYQYIKNFLLLEDVIIEDISIHDYRLQVIKDIPFLNKPLNWWV